MSSGGSVPALVTGEAVAVDQPPATVASRAVSGALDLVVQGVGLVILFFALGPVLASVDGATGAALTLVGVVGIYVGYPVLMESLTRGRTLGKMAMGLRTVRDDGGPVRFRQTLVRALLEVVEVWSLFGMPALISSICSARGKRLGDHLAGTYVVRERGTTVGSTPALMPYELVGWAQLSDIGRVPDGLAISVRQFLGRAQMMQPDARHAMAWALAAQMQPWVAPLPPAGTHPEAFLAAVLAERRRRDALRLARQAETVRRLTGRSA